MSPDREAGFKATDLVLIVLILALLVVGGSYVYKTYKTTGATAAEQKDVEAYLLQAAAQVRHTGWPWQGPDRCPESNEVAVSYWQTVVDGLAAPAPGSGVGGAPRPESVGEPRVTKVEFAPAQSSGKWEPECSVEMLAMRVRLDGVTAEGEKAADTVVIVMKD